MPDCYVSDMQHGPNPSVYAWPALTAEELNLDVVNKASPGASNLKILNEILNFDFNNDDTVIILWSFYQRDIIFYPDKILEIGHWVNDNISRSYYETHNDYDMAMKTILHIHHADMLLRQKNIKSLHLIKSNKDEKILKSILNDKLKWFDTVYHVMMTEYIDFGADNKHPGLKTHMLMSKIILNKLQEKYEK